MGSAKSSTPLHNKVIKSKLGQVSGKDRVYSIFWLNVTDPDLPGAMAEALKEKDADALIDLNWHQKYYYFVLFSISDFTVTGEAIKFNKVSVQREAKK